MPRIDLVKVAEIGEIADTFAWYCDGVLVESKIVKVKSETNKIAVYCQWPEDEHPD